MKYLAQRIFVCVITVQKAPFGPATPFPLSAIFSVWYAKDKAKIKYRQLFRAKSEIAIH